MSNAAAADFSPPGGETRRDFLLHTTTAFGTVGTAVMLWPLLQSMKPAADMLAFTTTDVNLGGIQEGQGIIVTWRGKPVFVRHRSVAEIEAARNVPLEDLRDPQPDTARTTNEKYLMIEASCTHAGCIPLGSKLTEPRGAFGGWFCPCHGSEYDTSGRVRKGPAPKNLPVPPYKFLDANRIVIG